MTSHVIHVHDMAAYPDAVYVGRANGANNLKQSALANPFVVDRHGDRAECVERYRGWLLNKIEYEEGYAVINAMINARDKPLACWCRHAGEERNENNICHADVVIEILERFPDHVLLQIAGVAL